MVERTPLVSAPGVLCTRALWEPQITGLADVAHVRSPTTRATTP